MDRGVFKVHEVTKSQTSTWQATANTILSGTNLKAFPLRSEIRKRGPLLPLLFHIVLEILARAVRQEKEINISKMKKWKQNCLFADDMILLYIYRKP